jgi:hypothetical protein
VHVQRFLIGFLPRDEARLRRVGIRADEQLHV